jgi:hypothetical protein
MTYLTSDSIATVITKAIGKASTGKIDMELAIAASEEACTEVRHILTAELTALLDYEGVAREWNEAIETALLRIEDLT